MADLAFLILGIGSFAIFSLSAEFLRRI